MWCLVRRFLPSSCLGLGSSRKEKGNCWQAVISSLHVITQGLPLPLHASRFYQWDTKEVAAGCGAGAGAGVGISSGKMGTQLPDMCWKPAAHASHAAPACLHNRRSLTASAMYCCRWRDAE